MSTTRYLFGSSDRGGSFLGIVFGGQSTAAESYSFFTNSWTAESNMLSLRSDMGSNGDAANVLAYGGNNAINSTQALSTSGTWQVRDSMNQGRKSFGSAGRNFTGGNDVAIAISGQDSSNNYLISTDEYS